MISVEFAPKRRKHITRENDSRSKGDPKHFDPAFMVDIKSGETLLDRRDKYSCIFWGD